MSNDAVFLVANGPSLNDITAAQWAAISARLVAGMCRSYLKVASNVFHWLPWPEPFVFDHERIKDIRCQVFTFGDSLNVAAQHVDEIRMLDSPPARSQTRPEDSAAPEPLVWAGHRFLGWSDDKYAAYANKSSTAVCLQLLAARGWKRIYLLGVDCAYGPNRENHFYDRDRVRALHPRVFVEQREALAYCAAHLEARGIEVYNCNIRSACRAFVKRPLQEVLQ